MKRLNVAVIGYGRSGRDIHENYLITDTEKFKILYVVDELDERRKMAERECGAKTLAGYKELYNHKNEIDFVVNTSYSYQHQPITFDLLNNGFNVLCEKPLAKTAAQVDELISASKKSGKMLAVFQEYRFMPAFEQMKKVIDSGVLGRIVQVFLLTNSYIRRWDWQTLQEFLGGSLYNTGPHPVDQAINLLDYDPNTKVFCLMDRVNTYGDADDFCKLILTAPNKPVLDIEISCCDAYPAFSYSVQGSQGGLTGSTSELKWRWFVPSESPNQKLIKTPIHDADWNPLYCTEKLAWHEDSWKTDDDLYFVSTKKLYSTVYDHLVNGKDLVVTPEQVRMQIAVQEEAHRQNSFWKM